MHFLFNAIASSRPTLIVLTAVFLREVLTHCDLYPGLQMARTQKNKATAHHLGLLKARLAKLRRELITPKGGGGGGTGEGTSYRMNFKKHV